MFRFTKDITAALYLFVIRDAERVLKSLANIILLTLTNEDSYPASYNNNEIPAETVANKLRDGIHPKNLLKYMQRTGDSTNYKETISHYEPI